MAHIPLTTQDAARGALAAVGTRFMPLAAVVDMATALLQADRDDPAVIEWNRLRDADFEAALAHERDAEADADEDGAA